MVNSSFSKMADAGDGNIKNFRGMGRARTLLMAINDFRERERGQRPPPNLCQRGRPGAPSYSIE